MVLGKQVTTLILLLTGILFVLTANTIGSVSAATTTINVNGVTLYAQNQPHRWGSCNVQDFKDKSGGHWNIASWGYWDTGNSYHSTARLDVHDGMLFGWFDQGGAPGFGCANNDEHDAGLGVARAVRQDFKNGALIWVPGMDHAQKINVAYWSAMHWALSCLTAGRCVYTASGVRAVNYAGYCLGFVYNAYLLGQGVRLKGGPLGASASAYQWWYGGSAKNTNAPFGTLVVWNRSTSSSDGHIALGLGGGYMLSTADSTSSLVHVERIATHNSVSYDGWEWPKW